MIGILLRVEVKPAKRQAFIDFMEEDVRLAKERELSMLRFDFYQDPKDETAFFVYEAYRDQKAFAEHKKNEPYQLNELVVDHPTPRPVMARHIHKFPKESC